MKVAVGMSGGVDSTLAACLMKDAGHDVLGITMQTWDNSLRLPDTDRPACFGPDEARDIDLARRLAARIGIPHETVSLAAEFQKEVLAYFRSEYLAGRTPNPCVRCNQRIKFGALLEHAIRAGLVFDHFVTGHYARVDFDAGRTRYRLRRGIDPAKDQSYFLSNLRQSQLAVAHFPLGEWTKERVREEARRRGFDDVADQPESQDFIACGGHEALFEGHGVTPGPIEDRTGRRLGTHRGIVHYTIGQRRGLGLGGATTPWYVVKLDAARNAVIVGERDDLLAGGLIAEAMNWIAEPDLSGTMTVRARIRQQHRETLSRVRALDAADPSRIEVVFDEPQTAVTPGQTVVLYDDDWVVGGGVILQALPA